ncbi:MAG: hypothetical protein ACREXX_12215 [Gammaproteobacteria bacterium]
MSLSHTSQRGSPKLVKMLEDIGTPKAADRLADVPAPQPKQAGDRGARNARYDQLTISHLLLSH